MKKLFRFPIIAIMAVMAMVVSSCNTDGGDDDVIYEQGLLGCYAMVTDMQTNTTQPQQIVSPITIKLQINWTKQKGSAWINGLKIGGMTYPTIYLSDFKWDIASNSWCYVKEAPAVVDSPTGITPTIKEFQLKWIDRLDLSQTLGTYDPGCAFSFIVDGRYRVEGSRQPIILGSKTTSTSPTGESFISQRTLYSVQLDFEKRTANIGIVQANFASAMPEMNMMFKNIPFTVEDYGRVIRLEKADLIPEIENTPQPEFPISSLKAELKPGTGMELNFNCNLRNKALYKVEAIVDYTSYKEAIR